ncbi:uncharacterized protein TNCV_4065461 [Trichonephila clavipes]|uniref:Uncharacterized protein n=1 Tax=Trichonephila clavipes TaxID=2585209 RepID=A0A8X6W8W5_TRICX|nr:uncharacterized protein TNCV_4065461 [Trichonephila clavipes]
MNYFPNNTPDHFQTKLAYPITLNGEWECCLSEVTIPGKYFTIHPDYNDSYSIETIENVESTSLTPEFVIPLYNEDYQEFTEGVNANVKKLIKYPPITFSLIENKTKIKININPYWELTITDEKANKFLRLLKLNPNKDYVVPGYPAGASITRNYSAPNANFFKNQEIRVALKSPLTKKIYEISLKDLNSSDIFDQITEKIIYETGDVSAVLKKQRNKVIVTLNSNIELRMNRNSCPLLMDALNIKTESHNIHHAIFPIRFDFSEITRKLDGEKFHLIEYENFPLIQEARKIYKLKIRSVEMSVPLHTKVTFGEKLSNMLGFRMNTFTEGNYTSDYILELRAGITEVYVYCDIIAPSLVGDVSASIS